MAEPARFSYTTVIEPTGARLLRPIVPIGLTYHNHMMTDALIDSGADANVLPYQLGLTLGANWNEARPVPKLSGNLGQTEARAIALEVSIHSFNSARMVFIWVKQNLSYPLLGQINFFQEFNVCFFGNAEYFEIRPKE